MNDLIYGGYPSYKLVWKIIRKSDLTTNSQTQPKERRAADCPLKRAPCCRYARLRRCPQCLLNSLRRRATWARSHSADFPCSAVQRNIPHLCDGPLQLALLKSCHWQNANRNATVTLLLQLQILKPQSH